MGRTRLLTDSPIKKAQALKHIEKHDLIEAQAIMQKKPRMVSDHTKIEVVKTFLALGGNLSLTSGATGIPIRTLHLWKTKNWWKEMTTTLKREEKLTLSAKTKRILDLSMDQTIDRLENGDFVIDPKSGAFLRKPVSARELNQITKDMMERKEQLDISTEEKQELKGYDDKLAMLAQRFADLAQMALEKPKPTIEVTDV
ncbi:MAG TPA: hypothetical protein VFM18_20605, partial [Methanosarcina sp.]|nr:hypothetical protein [Methanosarcina sp.]